jgi:hypothetical protein
VTLVVEKDNADGTKTVLAVPAYAAMIIAFLVFNPETDGRERIKGLEKMKQALSIFSAYHGIREINTYTTPDRGVAKWALNHGFETEERKVLRLNLNEEK